ncbi:hypothetical protein PPL_00513 [Heterostelium album PN500]|uniref:SMCHD1 ribosomal S5 domain-containing protein n=1 Tax=Heterostelium pallidum (strain ATCC 26659 / Pp 5 / PN500) TaxID=670386 RepID=D3AWN7_HETP5|nr:hypothetical protein PPL_00513 [Heterostelium album PN500]EFA86710.1 hypothetical protein PPL_00513 [Heterostelium album PN500]|eukprot:XP_020438814.1 hypothetical protein PPL_00513 [Heterostelium album PN500]
MKSNKKFDDKKRKNEADNNNNKKFVSPLRDNKKAKSSNESTSTEMVLKNLPTSILSVNSLLQVLISRKGQRYELETPATFVKFKNEVNTLNIIDSKVLLFNNLSNKSIQDEISYQQFLISLNNIIIVYTDGENPLEQPEELMVDVTPSKSILLKAGTSDYTTSNAFAEFIDNAIQAVRSNPTGDKTVKINIKKPDSRDLSSISFWDNGCGMSKDDLQRWATMGMSQADLEQKSQDTITSSDSVGSDKTATGMISRFGVGAKKAAFYLGTEILVVTKQKSNNWVNEATISLDILSATGDQEWKIPIKVRESTAAERSQQFTEVTIKNVPIVKLLLTPTSTFEDSIVSLKRELAHIYYYYIHTDPTDQSHYHFEEEEDSDEEDNTSPTENDKKPNGKPPKKGEYNLLLNDLDLVNIPDSMESLYIQHGKKIKCFELLVDTGAGELAKVKCHLRYFPYIQEKETLPIPYRVFLEHPCEDFDQLPLSLRKPGFEVFWNGRLIPEAHIERLGFMATGVRLDGEKIEEKYAQRVKGALFLTSAFPVNQNKTHIIKEHPIYLNLEKSGSRNNHNEWKKWILRCHKLDQDFQFETDVYDAVSNRTYCKSVSISGCTYYREDGIQLLTRPAVHGTIKQMYFSGMPELRTSSFFLTIERLNYKPLDQFETFPINKVKGKVAPAEFEKLRELQKLRMPSRIKIIEADKSPIPKTEYMTGDTITWVSVALLDSSKPPKEVEKRIIDMESIKIDLKIVYQPTNELVLSSSSSSYYEPGRASFRLSSFPFNRTGAYVFTFTCSYPNVNPATHYIKVLAGDPKKISAEYQLESDSPRIQLESPLPPIIVKSLDEHSNEVPFSDLPALEYTGSIVGSKTAVKFSKDFDVDIVDGRIMIQNMKVIGANLGDDGEANLVVSLKSKGMSCKLDPIRLISGPPVSISFVEDPFGEKVMNLTSVPPFSLILRDKSGNVYINESAPSAPASQKPRSRSKKNAITTPSEYIVATSTVLEESIVVTSDVQGYFNFQDSKALFIKEKIDLPFEETGAPRRKSTPTATSTVHVQFTFYKEKNEICTVEKQIIITPSSKPAFLKLIPLSESSLFRLEEDSYRAMSGSSLQFGIKVYGAGGGGRGPYELSKLKGKISTSWHPSSHQLEVAMNGANIFELPTLITDKISRAMMHWVSIKTDWDMDEKKAEKIDLKKEFSIQTTGGAPSTFFSQFGKGLLPQKIRCDSEVLIDLKLNDKRGNVVTPSEAKAGVEIEPYFVLKTSSEAQNAEIKSCIIEPFNTEKNMYPCRITMIGYGELTLIAKDKHNNVAEFPLKFTMIEGTASQVRVNGLSKLSVTCSRGDYLEEIKVTICDTLGNVISSNGIEIEYEWVNLQGNPPPLQIKSKTLIRAGVGSIKNMDITGVEGTYELRVSTKNISMQEATIYFIVKGSATIRLHNSAPIAVISNSIIPPIKISLINPDGQALVVQKSNVRLMLHMKSFVCSSTELDGSVYIFEDIPGPRKSGEYPLKFVYSTSVTNKVEFDSSLVVLPDRPVKLCTSSIIAPQTSSVLAKDFVIHAADQNDNKVLVNGSVFASIELSKQPQSQSSFFTMPVLIQTDPVPFNNVGDAIFPLLSLRESVGLSQAYRIRFTTNMKEINSHSIEFVYTNSKEDIDKKVELESQRVSLNKEINEASSQIDTIKSTLANFTSKKEQLRLQIEESKNNLLRFDPSFDKSKANPEEVRKTIQVILQEIDDMNSQPRRAASLPSNPISREMSELARSSTEETGIIGLVLDLFCIESKEEARVISKMAGRKLETVVVLNKDYLSRYYTQFQHSRNPVHFMSLDLISAFHDRNEQSSQYDQPRSTKLPLQLVPNAPTQGFVDFLVNRIQMKEKHEKLRRSLGWTLFKDCIVFQSLKDGMAYRDFCMKMKRNCGTIIALNELELIESSGMVMVGKKETATDDRFLLGQLPISESPDFARLHHKRHLWETFKRVNHEQYNYIKTNSPGVQDDMNKKAKLEEKVVDLKNHYQNVCEEIKKIESKLNQQ